MICYGLLSQNQGNQHDSDFVKTKPYVKVQCQYNELS